MSAARTINSRPVLNLLARLVDKSLVVYEEQPDGTARYRLLESTREYALRRLRERGEESIQRRHRACFLALAEEAHEKRFSAQAPALMETLEREQDNCRAALAFCAGGAD